MDAQAPSCDFCGGSISAGDLASGRAMMLMKKRFCRKCLQKAVERSKARPTDLKFDSTPSSTVGA